MQYIILFIMLIRNGVKALLVFFFGVAFAQTSTGRAPITEPVYKAALAPDTWRNWKAGGSIHQIHGRTLCKPYIGPIQPWPCRVWKFGSPCV